MLGQRSVRSEPPFGPRSVYTPVRRSDASPTQCAPVRICTKSTDRPASYGKHKMQPVHHPHSHPQREGAKKWAEAHEVYRQFPMDASRQCPAEWRFLGGRPIPAGTSRFAGRAWKPSGSPPLVGSCERDAEGWRRPARCGSGWMSPRSRKVESLRGTPVEASAPQDATGWKRAEAPRRKVKGWAGRRGL